MRYIYAFVTILICWGPGAIDGNTGKYRENSKIPGYVLFYVPTFRDQKKCLLYKNALSLFHKM